MTFKPFNEIGYVWGVLSIPVSLRQWDDGSNAWGKFRAITAPVDEIRANQHFRPICVLAYRSRAVLRPFLLPPACWVPVVDVVATIVSPLPE